ncbi:PAAR domain-containing protein [Pseudoduganella ginsengisoli]|uniref:PAAR domain-containing protein n=1 Tax=Pseudoduganella ginsengisoli TaxID=1462440 RepID=UPI0035306B46
MNVRRYTITLGASTTAGGKVISASANGSINGQQIALDNDLCTCGCAIPNPRSE